MTTKTWLTSLFILFLFTGTAFAQTGGDSSSGAEHECERRYQEDLEDAEEEDAPERRDEERREARERYEDCLADAREDDSSDSTDDSDRRGSDDDEDDSDDRRDGDDGEDSLVPDSYAGRHVSFGIAGDGITQYTVDDHPILANVSIDGSAEWDEFEAHGASIKLEGDGAELKVSDTPTGVFRFESEDDQFIQVTFADGIAARPADEDDHRGPGSHRLSLQGDGFQALLFTDEGYRLDNGTLHAPGEFRLVVIDAPGLKSKGAATLEGIADGRIAVEIDVPRDGLARGAQHGDINVTIQSEAGNLVATVEGHGAGKTVLFNLEPGSYTGLDDLTVLFDGEPIGLADSLEDVMNISEAEAEGSIAKYLILVGAQETQVLVQVPHFSVHTIELSGASLGGTAGVVSTIALLVGGGVATVFVAATLIGRGRVR